MVKEFNDLEEIQKYYDKETNTYVFKENGKYIDVIVFGFNLNIKANIDAYDITAYDITAYDINARDINALNISAYNINAEDISASEIEACDINALNINCYAICFANEDIVCNSIEGRRHNSRHFVLDGKLEVKDENN